jgi:hypothetical protein
VPIIFFREFGGVEMRRAVTITAIAGCLYGCTWLSPESLSKYSLDYNSAIQDSGDKLLVINVLRARDQAPLHFGDLPSIHETVQFTGGIAPTVLFGPAHAGSPSNTVAPTASIQDSPSFEMDNLDTQDFTNGIMSPIQTKVVKYWLDRGLDQRIALLLFFSSITVSYDPLAAKGPKSAEPKAPPERVLVWNEPRMHPAAQFGFYDPRGIAHSAEGITLDLLHQEELPFLNYLALIDWINGRMAAVSSDDKTAVGAPVYLGARTPEQYFKDIVRIDPKKYELDQLKKDGKDKKGWYQLYAVSDDKVISLCLSGGSNFTIKGGKPAAAEKEDDNDSCRSVPITKPRPVQKALPPCAKLADWIAAPWDCEIDKKRLHFTVTLRSAGDVVHFLGDLEYLQEHPFALQPKNHLNPLVTIGFPGDMDPSNGGVLFTLTRGAVPGRFQVVYADGTYTVGNANDSDHTLQVLSIVTQLINLNKSAKDLRETPTVKLIP